jgi:regulator of sirC expression with transglutaminase-like and TPR domain
MLLFIMVNLSGYGSSYSMQDEFINEKEDKIMEQIIKMPDKDINIGFTSLVIAKGYYPDIDIKKYLRQLDEMAQTVKEKIGAEKNPGKIIQIINDYLFDTKNIRMGSKTLDESYKNEANEAFLNKILDTGVGNCTSISTLYLALAERLKFPFYSVKIPSHVFIRYDDGKFRQNIETTDKGKEAKDKWYIIYAEEKLGVGKLAEDDIKYYGYLKNESKKNFLEGLLRVRARLVYNGGDKKRAQIDWQKAIKLSDNLGAIYQHIAMQFACFLNERNYDEALFWMSKAIKFSPEYYLFYQYRSRIYYMKSDIENALIDINKAVELNKFQPISYRERARIYESKKDYEKALVDIEKEIELMPHNFSSHYNRAFILWRKKGYDESLKELEITIKINPNYAMAYYIRGLVYTEIKENKKALYDFKKYLALEPDGQYAKTVKNYIEELKNNE